ncbi:hypothetical protein RHI9324_04908 [Rhizobium sp. CECT 9324]|nr:hypothetical protein RHI9324_04908 [Rhizobium sp. CECT 9324]
MYSTTDELAADLRHGFDRADPFMGRTFAFADNHHLAHGWQSLDDIGSSCFEAVTGLLHA